MLLGRVFARNICTIVETSTVLFQINLVSHLVTLSFTVTGHQHPGHIL
jgi:hypothetical protein